VILPPAFASPVDGLLFGTGAALVLALASRLRRRRRAPGVAVLHILLRGGALLAVSLLLAGPHRLEPTRHRGTLFALVDCSRSVAADDLQRAVSVLGERGTVPASVPLVVAGFGARISAASDLGAAARARDPDGEPRSHPGDALSALLAHPEARPGARLLVLTDGRVELPPPTPAAEALEPLVLGVPCSRRDRLRVTGLAKDPSAPAGGPPAFHLEGVSGIAQRARLLWSLDGRPLGTREVELPQGPFMLPLEALAGPGRHLLQASLECPADREFDNDAALVFEVPAEPQVLLVSSRDPNPLRAALLAQEIPVRLVPAQGFLAEPGDLRAVSVLILDGVHAVALSEPPLCELLEREIREGMGLVYLPPEGRAVLVDEGGRRFLDILPLVGEPLPPPPPQDPHAEAPPAPGPAEPDPASGAKERRRAPTLGLVLLIDASSSMRGLRLQLAKEAAIAAAEVLHPEDLVAVVAFSNEARAVLELTPAREQAEIADRIARISARGGTDFAAPLQLARDIFHLADLRIRHVILLSDGEPTTMRPYLPIVDAMVRDGITVSTVGCGEGITATSLSDIAARGRGKFYPAPSPGEIPQVFTIEAERIVATSGARRRSEAPPPGSEELPPTPAEPRQEPPAVAPEPLRMAWPAPYVRGLPWEGVAGVYDPVPARARRISWVALERLDGTPLLAHQAVGRGRVLAAAFALGGAAGCEFHSWRAFPAFLGQMVRELGQGRGAGRFDLDLSMSGRRLELRLVDARAREVDPAEFRVAVQDARGLELPWTWGPSGPGRIETRAPATRSGVVVLRVTAPDGEGLVATTALPPLAEDAEVGEDLAGLAELARRLRGQVAGVNPEPIHPPGRTSLVGVEGGAALRILLLILVALDLLLLKLLPGRASGPLPSRPA
jgi:Mg-chelatase subunit ChlD